MQGVNYDLTADAWTMVAFNSSSAIVVPRTGGAIRGHKASEAAPAIDTTKFFVIRAARVVQGIAPFEALWLRADAMPTGVTVYAGESMSGAVFFGNSPFRLEGPGAVKVTVPFVPQTIDGGAPGMSYDGLAVIDLGGPIAGQNLRTIDGRIAGETP